jgi:rod shape determining protein RodA
VVNIGMSLGLLPVVGVPLPFLSYGGSSLLANMIMAGILLNLYAHRKEY